MATSELHPSNELPLPIRTRWAARRSTYDQQGVIVAMAPGQELRDQSEQGKLDALVERNLVLYDRLAQRTYGAAINLASLRNRVGPDLAGIVDAIEDDLDLMIKELRQAAFEGTILLRGESKED
jgi:hypothetical protein